MNPPTISREPHIEKLVRQRALRNRIRQYAEELSALYTPQEIANALTVIAGEIITQEVS